MAQPSKRAAGRALADFLPLRPAEQLLLKACREGTVAVIGNKLPTETVDSLLVRASLLRFLLLGGDEDTPVHEQGVHVLGAIIEGPLDLLGSGVPHSVGIHCCRFAELLRLQDARVQGSFSLSGSAVAGIDGERVVISGSCRARPRVQCHGGSGPEPRADRRRPRLQRRRVQPA
jgi:hypothetical protein